MGAYEALAGCYDRLTNDVDYERVVAFYHEILRREGVRPRTAVDLACGTGSVALILARNGIRTIGVDMSEEMLTVACSKAQELEQAPLFICQKLQELYLPRGVDLAVCALDSLDYITEPEHCRQATSRATFAPTAWICSGGRGMCGCVHLKSTGNTPTPGSSWKDI